MRPASIPVLLLVIVSVVAAQTGSGILNWLPNGSNVTMNGPTSSGLAFTYALPPRSGTVALTSDLLPSAPAPSLTSGTITLTGGTGSASIPSSIVRCIVSDGSGNSVKYSRTSGTLTVFGVGPTVDYICV